MDIALYWDSTAHRAVMRIVNGDLDVDRDIQTAVILSLFTNRRAEDDDALPDVSASRQGWWGDALGGAGNGRRIGSRLWLLGREKQQSEVLARAREYAEESLAWLVEDGVVSGVSVAASIATQGVLALSVSVTKPKAAGKTFKFEFAWSKLSEARS